MDKKKQLIKKVVNELSGKVFYNSKPFTVSEKVFFINRYLKILNLMPQINQDSVGLEAGVHSAMLALSLKRHFKLTRLFGLDHPVVIKKYKKDFLIKLKKENVIIKPADLHNGDKFPWPANYFDFVICSEVLEHLVPSDAPILLKEIKRILKNSGFVLITTPNATSLTKRINMLRGKNPFEFDFLVHDGATFGHIREYTANELELVAKSSGFKIISRQYFMIDEKRSIFMQAEQKISQIFPFFANNLALLIKKN